MEFYAAFKYSISFRVDPNPDEMQTLHGFGYVPLCPAKKLKLIRWIPPITDFCLNVDGACKGNPGECGGGGCIRDSKGQVLVNSFGEDKMVSWRSYRWWREAKSLISRERFLLSHVYRETNQLTNALANFAVKAQKQTYWYKPQCGSARHKPLAGLHTCGSSRHKPLVGLHTVYSPTAGQKSFLEKKDQTESYYKMNTQDLAHSHRLSPKITMSTGRKRREKKGSLKARLLQMLEHFFLDSGSFSLFL
ncbi:hypothetical protein Taro_032239 [Colocasia esculenta]|uniref:RNase H type-1 domain-containing protein n=1 Tax=Colocasia esculenta TaxID=4460 RepID=A0A843VUA9_COLES|nr:hypothetical protein [Colocasia esculenta]